MKNVTSVIKVRRAILNNEDANVQAMSSRLIIEKYFQLLSIDRSSYIQNVRNSL